MNDADPGAQPEIASVRQEGLSAALGREIVGGRMQPGDVVTLDALQQRFEVSRTVARDAVKVLESLGLLYSKRRVGLVVKSPSEWNVYAPAVIAWRLESEKFRAAFVELTQLRIAVEPEAAALAAAHRTEAQAHDIEELAGRLRWLGEAGRLEQFMSVDIAFHRLLLTASGNMMFDALGDVVAQVLIGRTQLGMMPARPRAEALDAHENVARSVAAKDPEAARKQMQPLVEEVRAALKP